MDAAGQAVPQKPTIPDRETRELRALLILEEALEAVSALGFVPKIFDMAFKASGMIRVINEPISIKNIKFFEELEPNLVEIADACADIQVVTLGTTLACGIDQEPVDAEVNRSNMSKFVDGHRDEVTGKWIKGPSYSPANILPILESQK